MIADPGFIDLDHLTHRILVTHRLLLQCMKKPSVPKVRKILDVINQVRAEDDDVALGHNDHSTTAPPDVVFV